MHGQADALLEASACWCAEMACACTNRRDLRCRGGEAGAQGAPEDLKEPCSVLLTSEPTVPKAIPSPRPVKRAIRSTDDTGTLLDLRAAAVGRACCCFVVWAWDIGEEDDSSCAADSSGSLAMTGGAAAFGASSCGAVMLGAAPTAALLCGAAPTEDTWCAWEWPPGCAERCVSTFSCLTICAKGVAAVSASGAPPISNTFRCGYISTLISACAIAASEPASGGEPCWASSAPVR